MLTRNDLIYEALRKLTAPSVNIKPFSKLSMRGSTDFKH